MRKSRASEGQMIGVLRDRKSGASTAEVCRRHRSANRRSIGRRSTAGWRRRTRSA